MKKLQLLAILFIPFMSFSQNYSVSLVPDSLKQNANAVKRYEELRIEIKDVDKAIIKHKYAITILNEDGRRYGYYVNFYNKFRSISDISAKMYNEGGQSIQSLKKKDISDVSTDDDESLLTDGRVKRFAFINKQYPYTVEFEDEVELKGIYNFQTWLPISNAKLSVQNCSYIVQTPSDYKLRYKEVNFPNTVQINSAKTITYTWRIENAKAKESEPLMPDFDEVLPAVYIAPSEFEYGGYKGNMSSWLDIGKYQLELNKGREVLPDNVKQKVHQLTDGLSSTEEKVKVLYEFMQQNTRYISVQLGIGGFQPFEAKYVAEKKYGDCKALSNYMVSLVKEAGIKANYVNIRAGFGENGVIEDFPFDRFNHVIMCVPMKKDTLWLECTSQTESAGYLGKFTGNRKALLIDDDGGHIVNTPAYKVEDNLLVRKITATIDDNGNLETEVNSRFTGLQQERLQGLIHGATKEEKEKYLNRAINLPTYTVIKNEYKETKGRIPVIDEYLKISAPNYASISGKRLFIVPDLFDKEAKLPNNKPRQFEIELGYPFRDVDTINVKIPAGYAVESLPKETVISNKFGKYSIVSKVNENAIILYRLHEEYMGHYPAKDYDELVKFYDDMYKADRAKIVLVKKE
jgi:hypothetical protein